MTVLAPTRQALDETFGESAPRVDRGDLPASHGLTRLGDAGLLDLGAPSNEDGRLGDMARLVSGIAERSLASAFTLWAHRMVIEYLLLASEPGDRSRELDDLRSGRLPGATAMASALGHLLGHGDLGVHFRRTGDGIRLDGRIRWASNLFPDGFLLVTAAVGDDGEHVVVAVPSDRPGVRVDPSPELLALDGTASSSVTLDDVAIDPHLVLTTDLSGFLSTMRGPFLLLQSAFAHGLAKASLRAAAPHLDGVNDVFSGRFDELRRRFARVDRDLDTFCRSVDGSDDILPIVELRLEATLLARDAVDLEGRVRGGAGYLRSSPTARRIREAAFLSIQSPTEGFLRWELRCSNS